MKVGNLVRRKPNPVTRQPEILGLVTEMITAQGGDATIRVTFIDPERNTHHAQHWLSASHFEVVS